jgi:hypothetical protein
MKRMASGKKSSKSSDISSAIGSAQRPFALCLTPGDYPGSLERMKLYRLLPDAKAQADGLLRVIDESGEDYLFPTELFKVVTLSAAVSRAIRA